jgi:hypothetical protein
MMLLEVYEHWDFRGCSFVSAVRLWGMANRPFSTDVLAST